MQNLRRERSPSLHRLGTEPHRQLTTDVHRQGPANHTTALQSLAICTYRSNWGEFRCILMLFWATPFTCSGLIAALSTDLEICCVWRGVRKRAGAAAISFKKEQGQLIQHSFLSSHNHYCTQYFRPSEIQWKGDLYYILPF